MQIPMYREAFGASRDRPAEFFKGYGWLQDERRKRVRKPHYHFIWPKDGQNGSKWSRAKDILTGKGPDIHVTVSANKMDYMHHRHRKETWGNHLNIDDRRHEPLATLQAPWANRFRRDPNFRYDFLTRTYRRPDRHMMTDAIWKEGVSRKQCPFPRAFRDSNGDWWDHDPYALDPFWYLSV